MPWISFVERENIVFDNVVDEAQTKELAGETYSASGVEPASPVRIRVDGTEAYSRKRIRIEAAEGTRITVFEDLRAESSLAVHTELEAGKNAVIRLIQLQSAGVDALLYSEVTGNCAENGRVELTQILMGEGGLYSDSRFELKGDGSGLKAGIGYLGRKNQKIDINLVANHYGKHTESEIEANGALKDSAQKVFRGTIDFKHGSAGSTGSEQETVLLLGDDVVNKTVPLILCAEENVEGTHGATIGALDDDTLFYFESRGFDRAAAEDLMARAAVERLAHDLGDDATAETVQHELNGGM
mgnify:CR=1 FL=1